MHSRVGRADLIGDATRLLDARAPDACYGLIDSKLGVLCARSDGAALTGLGFDGEQEARRLEALGLARDDAFFSEVGAQLADYFAGQRRAFSLALAPRGSVFQRAVWQALVQVGYGKTTTYGALARAVGRPRAARAVGSALGANPLPIVVACHRVLGTGKHLGGYSGGLERKLALLALER